MGSTADVTAHDPLLGDLTDAQRQAVMHGAGPLLVIAAAGSGKTRVITRRIAHLVQRHNVAPWQVLAITFTNKAAGEMRERVAQLLSPRQARAVTLATFHGLCARLLREYAETLGLPARYAIYDEADQARAMKQALKDAEICVTHFPPGKVLATISQAKNELIEPDAYAAAAGDFYAKTVARLYRQYQAVLKANGALDFDDLLLQMARLLKLPQPLAELQERFQYVLIDEYQDTNHAQFVIASALAAKHRNICATGDPDQSIYRWRGADIRNILEFESHYPNATVVRLENNYRSTKRILAAADALIGHNKQRRPKRLITDNEAGSPIDVICCADESHEARVVIDRFTELHDRLKLPWREMAVFYRTNALSRVIEEAARRAGVPYQIARGTAFYQRMEVKDALAYLRVIANPDDAVNLARIINLPPRGIGEKTVKILESHAASRRVSLYQAMQESRQIPGLTKRAAGAVAEFAQLLETWRRGAGLAGEDDGDVETSLPALVDRVLRESGLERHYSKDPGDSDQQRLMNIGELISATQEFEREYVAELPEDAAPTLAEMLPAYLEQVSLVSDIDAVDPEQGAVTLMTLHAAKGLEFAAVAMIGLEDGLLPHSQSSDHPAELEEERRLCFVGITRCRRHLMMSYARYRTMFGQTQPTIPSRFLTELDPAAIRIIDRSEQVPYAAGAPAKLSQSRPCPNTGSGTGVPPVVGRDGRPTNSISPFRAEPDPPAPSDAMPPSPFTKGTLVRHPKFGLGRVLEQSTSAAYTKLKIHFNTAGTKTLVLEYAPLEIVVT